MLFERTKTPSPPPASGLAPAPDLDCQARLHRDRMAGMWAAELLGLIGHAAHDYARDLTHPRAVEGGDNSPDADGDASAASEARLIRRLSHDLRGKVAPQEIRHKLAHLLHEARRQLNRDQPPH